MKKEKKRKILFAGIGVLGIILICLVGLITCDEDNSVQPPEEKPIPGDYDMSVKVDTTTRWFKLVIPPNYDHTEPRPLIFCFHGGGLSMAFVFNNRKDLIQRCEQENWIMAIPNGSNFLGNRGAATWSAVHCCNPSLKHNVDEIGFVREIVDTLSAYLKIDATRIYATGGSNGGMLSHRLAAEMPDVFAAVALSAGTIGGQVDSLSPVITIQPTQPVPIMMMHGLNDRNVNYFGDKTLDGDRIDISLKESTIFWAENNQCTVSQADTNVVDGLKGKVWIVSFSDCDANKEVRAVSIQNHGHGWPSQEDSGYDGTKAMVDFLKRFSK